MSTKSLDLRKFRTPPGRTVRLSRWDASDTSAFDGEKAQALDELAKLRDRLDSLQELLYADRRHALLVVLQGMDTSGKDGAIRGIFRGMNPQGVGVTGFKAPTPEEAAHDFLWRVHARSPARGYVSIFNRSHYEDVLVPRVHRTAPSGVWRARYRSINDFEKLLVEEGTTVLKFFLHIDADEQKRRLRARLADPTKHWKFNAADLAERERWPEYMTAYGELLGRTCTRHAPWHIVPSNRKWFRDLLVGSVVAQSLEGLDLHYPALPRAYRRLRFN